MAAFEDERLSDPLFFALGGDGNGCSVQNVPLRPPTVKIYFETSSNLPIYWVVQKILYV